MLSTVRVRILAKQAAAQHPMAHAPGRGHRECSHGCKCGAVIDEVDDVVGAVARRLRDCQAAAGDRRLPRDHLHMATGMSSGWPNVAAT
jgi:hypothetical protein